MCQASGPAWFKTAAAKASVRPCRAEGTLPMRMSFASESNFGKSKKSKLGPSMQTASWRYIIYVCVYIYIYIEIYQTSWYVHHHPHKKPSINLVLSSNWFFLAHWKPRKPQMPRPKSAESQLWTWNQAPWRDPRSFKSFGMDHKWLHPKTRDLGHLGFARKTLLPCLVNFKQPKS